MIKTTTKLPSYLENKTDVSTLINTARQQVKNRFPNNFPVSLPKTNVSPLWVEWNGSTDGILLSDGSNHKLLSYVYKGEFGCIVFENSCMSAREYYRITQSLPVTRIEESFDIEKAVKLQN